MAVDPSVQWLLGITLVVYFMVMTGISLYSRKMIHSTEDFLVAGRRLPLSLSWMTLLAVWFGAGTILAASDEVRREGLQAAALDPLGAGCCLLLAGLLVAGPMWRMKLLTVCDFFRNRYGKRAELISAAVLVPSYFGWVAAQYVALAEVLQFFFGLPTEWGLLLVATVATVYTLMGGMWAVTLTDAVQIVIVLAGLLILTAVVIWELGTGSYSSGLARIANETPAEMLVLIPRENWQLFLGWIGVFLVGALGNIPGQDLMQRIFAAKSDRTAVYSCYIAGTVYLLFGCLPPLLALAGNLLFPESLNHAILPALAQAFLSPWLAVVFLLALMSAILSTVDTAILSPASVLAQNVFSRFGPGNMLNRNRWAVLIVAVCSLLVAYSGENAYSLLEEAYMITLVGLFVPLIIGIYFEPYYKHAGSFSILVGTGTWAIHFFAGWENFLEPYSPWDQWAIPLSLAATFLSLVAYLGCQPFWKMQRISQHKQPQSSNAAPPVYSDQNSNQTSP